MEKIQGTGFWEEHRGLLNRNFERIEVELMKLKGAAWKIAGFFVTADALPQGAEGSIAYVGTTAPYAIYAWAGAAWQATGQTFTPSVDIDGLATLEQATQIANAALASANRYADSLTRGVESELDALEERIAQGYATKDYADTAAAEAAAAEHTYTEDVRRALSIVMRNDLASAMAYTDERTAPPAGGIFRPLYEAAGAAFNEQTGFYELNGLTDITEAQMAVIYAAPRLGGGGDWGKAFHKYAGLRTNLCTEEGATGGNAPRYRFMQTFATARDAEFIRLSADLQNGNPGRIFVTLDDRGFAYCSNLREIRGIINYSEVTSQSNLANTFVGCTKLETVQVQGLKHNLAIPSPVLSLESLQYLVAQRSGTNAITVTLHADVLARVNSTEPAWQQLKADATAKNITFA